MLAGAYNIAAEFGRVISASHHVSIHGLRCLSTLIVLSLLYQLRKVVNYMNVMKCVDNTMTYAAASGWASPHGNLGEVLQRWQTRLQLLIGIESFSSAVVHSINSSVASLCHCARQRFSSSNPLQVCLEMQT